MTASPKLHSLWLPALSLVRKPQLLRQNSSLKLINSFLLNYEYQCIELQALLSHWHVFSEIYYSLQLISQIAVHFLTSLIFLTNSLCGFLLLLFVFAFVWTLLISPNKKTILYLRYIRLSEWIYEYIWNESS